jgi:hypothetical protein
MAVYVKLPNGFYSGTPVGKYNPGSARLRKPRYIAPRSISRPSVLNFVVDDVIGSYVALVDMVMR